MPLYRAKRWKKGDRALTPIISLNPVVFEAIVLQTFQLCQSTHSTFCLKWFWIGFLTPVTIRDLGWLGWGKTNISQKTVLIREMQNEKQKLKMQIFERMFNNASIKPGQPLLYLRVTFQRHVTQLSLPPSWNTVFTWLPHHQGNVLSFLSVHSFSVLCCLSSSPVVGDSLRSDLGPYVFSSHAWTI